MTRVARWPAAPCPRPLQWPASWPFARGCGKSSPDGHQSQLDPRRPSRGTISQAHRLALTEPEQGARETAPTPRRFSPRVRTSLQKHRRRPLERRRLHQRTRLHRADLLAAVPEIPRRPGARQGHRSRPRRQEIRPHPRQALPLGIVGRAEGQGRQDRPQHRPHRRRPHRLRQRQALPLPARLQGQGHRPEHHRIQDRRNLRRDQEPHPERLQPARDHRPHRRTPLPVPDREARTLAPLRSQDQKHGQRRAQRRRVLHPAPAHSRHRRRHRAPARRDHLRPRRRLGRLPLRILRLPQAPRTPSAPPPRTAPCKSAPSTGRKRSPSPTSSRS